MQLIWDQIQKFSPELDRESDYGQAWVKGMTALGQAQDEDSLRGFHESSDGFLQAFEINAERPEAMMGLAYLLVLLGDELTALHYVRLVLEHRPDNREARELHELLDSSHRLNSLLDDVERLSQVLGLHEQPEEAEIMTAEDASRLVDQTEMLLQIQHKILVVELNLGMFKRLDQLNSRQRSLETLFDMLSAHLTHFLEDPQFGERLQKRLDVLAFDLESLQNLENLFDELRQFQKDVQNLFRELTRRIIQLRMHKATEDRSFLAKLQQELATLKGRLEAFPAAMRHQVENASGWPHLMQQKTQLEQVLKDNQLAG